MAAGGGERHGPQQLMKQRIVGDLFRNDKTKTPTINVTTNGDGIQRRII
jgi:hypothetical protein